MGAGTRYRTAGPRDRVLSRLRTAGEITDPGGLASAALAKAVGYPGSSAAFAQLLSGMERDGLIEREVRGKRTYRIRLADGEGKPPRSEVLSGSTAPARNEAPALDYDELAMRLLAQVVRRIAAAPAEDPLPHVALPVARALPGSDPERRGEDLTLVLASLELRLASIQLRQREWSEVTAMLREQLAAARRSLAEIQAGFADGWLDPEEQRVLQRLLSSLHATPARRRSSEAG